MKENETDELKALFASFEWNTEEPNEGHELRFLQKLDRPKRRRRRLYGALSIAASVVLLLGVFLWKNQPAAPTYQMSPENREAQTYFASVIRKELATIQKEDTPVARGMVDDAVKQMAKMEADYDRLAAELARKGENEQLIFAMITNLKTRIEFLERVSHQIETIKQIHSEAHEDENTL